jgi:hypothetical protein
MTLVITTLGAHFVVDLGWAQSLLIGYVDVAIPGESS